MENTSEPKVGKCCRCDKFVQSIETVAWMMTDHPDRHSFTSDGRLRKALLQREIKDHKLQHERLHDQDGPDAEGLHAQHRLPESPGRDVSNRWWYRDDIKQLPGQSNCRIIRYALLSDPRASPCHRSWVGYEKENFRGHQYLLEEGEYHDWRVWGGCDAEMRSVRVIRAVSLQGIFHCSPSGGRKDYRLRWSQSYSEEKSCFHGFTIVPS